MPVFPVTPSAPQRVFGAALARHIHQLGLGTYDPDGAGGDVFYARMPSSPDKAIMVMPSGGEPDLASGTLPYDVPVTQVMVRGERTKPLDTERRAWAIYDALNGLHRVTLDQGGEDEIYLVGMTAMQPPVHVDTDKSGRDTWTINFRARVRRPSQHRAAI